MITSGRDGKMIIWNTLDNFKIIGNIKSNEANEEINQLVYLSYSD
jgi:hypothetical protein